MSWIPTAPQSRAQADCASARSLSVPLLARPEDSVLAPTLTFLNTYCVHLKVLSHLIPCLSCECRFLLSSFTNEETRNQREQVTFSRLHNWLVGGARMLIIAREIDSRSQALFIHLAYLQGDYLFVQSLQDLVLILASLFLSLSLLNFEGTQEVEIPSRRSAS